MSTLVVNNLQIQTVNAEIIQANTISLTSSDITVSGNVSATALSGNGASVTSVTPADDTVTTAKVVDYNITTVKIANGSITTEKFASNADITVSSLTVNTAVAAVYTNTAVTGSTTLDFSSYQDFVLTMSNNVTLANPTTEQVGQSGVIVFIQDATGSRTVSLGTDYETPGNTGITLSTAASTTDLVPYKVIASGRILLGTPQLAYS